MRPTVRATAVLALTAGLAACGGEPGAGGSASTPAPSSSAAQPSPSPSEAPGSPVPGNDAEARVADALAGLDRREQVAQLFVVGVPADSLATGARLVEQGAGGVFLAGRPTESAAQLSALTAAWREQNTGPGLWIAVDQEGGSVQTLKGEGFERLPSATVQGDLPGDQLADLAGELGRRLSGAGVNLNLAPVVDVVPAGTEADNGPIGFFDRQYGSTGAEVVPAATAVVDGLAAAGVTSTLKHFPGLGLVRGNTDDTADVVDAVTTAGDDQVTAFAETLSRTEAEPMVMMSSATYSRIDPASRAAFSPVVIGDLLRGELGFSGPVISDDLGSAVAVTHVPVGERAVRFLAAGGTLVLTVAPDTFPAMLEAVLARDAADPAFAAVVDSAVHTALLAKAEAGLLG
ncbi:glycoside hydrolase family 3 N-terminal domain-containing protein [Blastococcus sp. SYSU DS0617]